MNYAKSDLELMVGSNERILWKGKPNKRCYFLEGIFNPMLPFAVIWALIDSLICVFGQINLSDPTVLLFLLIHMMPVWIYIGGLLFICRRYKNTEYIVTDKGVYVSGGLFSYTCKMKPYTELARVNIHRGIIDQLLGVGDIVLTSNNLDDLYASNVSVNGQSSVKIGLRIEDIKKYKEVFSIIKKLQEDIYTDTMYPNDLRPKENHGYQTKYNP